MDRSERQRKISYITTAMVIMLCLIAITGATFALFTDTNDGTIGVNATSGDLEVDIVGALGDDPDSLVGKVLNFARIDPETGEIKPLEDVLFEPGAKYHTEGFRIQNDGGIPLKYILFISKGEKGEEFSQAFDVWITTDPDDDSVQETLPEFESIVLKPGDFSEVYYLVFRMKPTAGNEFQGKTYSGIGITAFAVQGNANV